MSSAHRAAIAGRRLRALVARLHGCLADLSPGPARLLALRAGLLGRPALSAAGTARVLGVTFSVERRLERRAVRALRGAASSGCGASGAAPGLTVSSVLAAGVTNELSARPAGASSPAGTGTPGSTHAAARHGVTRSAGSGVPPAGHGAPTMTERASGPAGTPSRALITALAALALAGAFALQRAYRGPARPAAPAAAQTPAAVVAPAPVRTSSPAASGPVPAAPPAASAQAPVPSARPTAHTPSPSAPSAATTPVPSALAAAPDPGESRSWGRHEVEVVAVTLTAIAGGAARLVSLARRRSARRR